MSILKPKFYGRNLYKGGNYIERIGKRKNDISTFNALVR